MKYFLLLSAIVFLSGCGGGGGGSDTPVSSPPPTPPPPANTFTPPPVTPINNTLLAAPLIVIDDQNAKIDILENIVFSLEFFGDFVANVSTSILISNILNNQSLDSLSKAGTQQTCLYSLIDNDNTGTITAGDSLDVTLDNCPHTQDLAGFFYGETRIEILSVINDNTRFLIEVNFSLEGLSFRSKDDVVVAANGEVFARVENLDRTSSAITSQEYSSVDGEAIQFTDIDGNTLTILDPFFGFSSSLNAFNAFNAFTLGAAVVADSTLNGTYSCPNSSLHAFLSTNYPASGVLIRCEGEAGSFASVDVSSPGSATANLTVGATVTSVFWDDFFTLILARNFGTD